MKFVGIELGSTRIKAVAVDESFNVIANGAYSWKSELNDGYWTYPLDDVRGGFRAAVRELGKEISLADTDALGISAMMHGYLAFDEEWNLLVPFRTWQNTVTGEASVRLSELFGFNIPQRWSIAHLYQAILNKEEHVGKIRHITTLAGYMHFLLTGVNAVGIGDASGMFPVDVNTHEFNSDMLEKFRKLDGVADMPWDIADIMPEIRLAGDEAGRISASGSVFLEGMIPEGTLCVPCEGDAGTGMTATNSVGVRTGNISAGTSIFSMVVLDDYPAQVHEEIDLVTTPQGAPVAMIHCNNCTQDMNAWIRMFRESVELFGIGVSDGELFEKLFRHSLAGSSDCSGVVNCNYYSGEGVTHMDKGIPAVIYDPGRGIALSDFIRSLVYSSFATLKLGMDILAEENVKIDSITGHGGLFKTEGVAQRFLAGALGIPVTCMKSAGEGGAYGMALLAAYTVLKEDNETMERFLSEKVFKETEALLCNPESEITEGFARYVDRFRQLAEAERKVLK